MCYKKGPVSSEGAGQLSSEGDTKLHKHFHKVSVGCSETCKFRIVMKHSSMMSASTSEEPGHCLAAPPAQGLTGLQLRR